MSFSRGSANTRDEFGHSPVCDGAGWHPGRPANPHVAISLRKPIWKQRDIRFPGPWCYRVLCVRSFDQVEGIYELLPCRLQGGTREAETKNPGTIGSPGDVSLDNEIMTSTKIDLVRGRLRIMARKEPATFFRNLPSTPKRRPKPALNLTGAA